MTLLIIMGHFLGCTEFLIVKILANKFKFIPKFIPEKSYDMVNYNGTLSGMFHRVRVTIKVDKNVL